MKESSRDKLKKELKRLFRSMDFVSNQFLKKEKSLSQKEFQIFFNIYQQLGMAWEYLGLQCKHWEGYRKTKNKPATCHICGKVKGADERNLLLPKKDLKKIGKRVSPNSKRIFANKREAAILDDTIEFHGTRLRVEVHNAYKSRLFQE